MTDRTLHELDTVQTACTVAGCNAPRVGIENVSITERPYRNKRGRARRWQLVRLRCRCSAGHTYTVKFQQRMDDQEDAGRV